MIVEYKMHRNINGEKITPSFIKDGGYFMIGDKLVGKTYGDGSYVPSTLVTLDESALVARITSLNLIDPKTDEELDADEIQNLVTSFLE